MVAKISPTALLSIQIKLSAYISEFPEISPVVFLLKIADGDETRAAANSKLVLFGWPFHTASGTVDPEDDQGGLPSSLFQGPHVGVTVRSTGNYTVTFRSPIDTCEIKRKNLSGTHFHSLLYITSNRRKRKKSSAIINVSNASKINNWLKIYRESFFFIFQEIKVTVRWLGSTLMSLYLLAIYISSSWLQ